jgi:hypothetical protein
MRYGRCDKVLVQPSIYHQLRLISAAARCLEDENVSTSQCALLPHGKPMKHDRKRGKLFVTASVSACNVPRDYRKAIKKTGHMVDIE